MEIRMVTKGNVVKYSDTCPGCGHAWKYKKAKFYICPSCRAALVEAEKIDGNEIHMVCRHCGAQVSPKELMEDEENNTQVFICCRNCGRPKFSAQPEKFFACYKCGDEIVRMSDLKETEVGKCPTCNTDLSHARKLALAWEKESN